MTGDAVPCPAARSPRRRRSSSSAPTAAASSTPTPPTRSRTRRPDQPARDLPAAADPVQPAAHVRHDGRRPPAGLRDRSPRWPCSGRPSLAVAALAETAPGRCAALAAGAAMEGKEVRFGVPASALFAASTTGTSTGAVNSMHDATRARRRRRAVEHDARRGRARRRRLRALRHAGARDHRGVRRRPDGRAHAGVPGQEDRPPRDEARRALHPDDAGAGAGRRRARDGAARARPARDAQPRPARLHRGALRLRLGGEQQRLRVRRTHRHHDFFNPPWHLRCCSAGSCRSSLVAGASPARWPRRSSVPRPRAPCRPHAPCSSACWSARSSGHRPHLLPGARARPLAEALS